MSEDPPSKSLRGLEARLKRLRDETRPRDARADANQPVSGIGMAFAVSSHLVAGLGVGALIGYWLDRWLGTSPWLLIAFFFLGAAAGMLNVYRTVTGMGLAVGYRPPAGDDENEQRSGDDPAAGLGEGKGGNGRGQSH